MEKPMAEEQKPKVMKVGDVLGKDKAAKSKSESKAAPKAASKEAPKKKHKHVHIENHFDEKGKSTGHTVRMQPVGGGEETSFTAPDLDAVHDGLEEHMGDPNADEGQEGAEPQAAPQTQQAV
jgi:hypothetical protein